MATDGMAISGESNMKSLHFKNQGLSNSALRDVLFEAFKVNYGEQYDVSVMVLNAVRGDAHGYKWDSKWAWCAIR